MSNIKLKMRDYCDFIARKERVFEELVNSPADHYIDLFWVRLLPYVAVVEAGESVGYRLLLRNNLERPAKFSVRLLPPPGWVVSAEPVSVSLEPEGRHELTLSATAPPEGDQTRRLVTAEVCIDGISQGPVSEALVTVR